MLICSTLLSAPALLALVLLAPVLLALVLLEPVLLALVLLVIFHVTAFQCVLHLCAVHFSNDMQC